VSADVEQQTPGWMDDSDHAGGHTALCCHRWKTDPPHRLKTDPPV
jgi:hypothetical protein